VISLHLFFSCNDDDIDDLYRSFEGFENEQFFLLLPAMTTFGESDRGNERDSKMGKTQKKTKLRVVIRRSKINDVP
jgi:hypothetical protein